MVIFHSYVKLPEGKHSDWEMGKGWRWMVKLGDFGDVCYFMSKKSHEFRSCGG